MLLHFPVFRSSAINAQIRSITMGEAKVSDMESVFRPVVFQKNTILQTLHCEGIPINTPMIWLQA